MKPVYLSHFLDENTPLYGGAKGVQVQPDKKMHCGDSCNTLKLSLPNHSGTHIDLPFHFVPDGKKLEDFPANYWVMKSHFLIELPQITGTLINLDLMIPQLKSAPDSIEILLIKTGLESRRMNDAYWNNYPGLDPQSAKYLRDRFPNLKAVGLDTISASSILNREAGRVAHREFLSREILIIEDMRMEDYSSTLKWIFVSPLLIKGADGVPVTITGFY